MRGQPWRELGGGRGGARTGRRLCQLPTPFLQPRRSPSRTTGQVVFMGLFLFFVSFSPISPQTSCLSFQDWCGSESGHVHPPLPQEWGMALGHFLWAAMWWPRVTKSQQVGKSWPYTPKRKILLTNKELLFKITQKFHFPYTLCTNLSSHPEKPLFKRTDKPNLYLLLKVMKLNLRWLP